MKHVGLLGIFCLMAGVAHADAARDEATAILKRIVTICEEQGLDACEPHLRGLDPLFDYHHAYGAMKETEGEFVDFVRKRYQMPDFTMNKMAAHVDPKINASVSRSTFEGKIEVVKKVADGYDVTIAGQGTMALRLEKDVWVAKLPPEAAATMKALQTYTLASQLKRSIMIYRMEEALILDYDLDDFATRFVADLQPLVVAVMRKPELVEQLPDWQSKLQDVMEFYSQFKSVDDMRADIAKKHGK